MDIKIQRILVPIDFSANSIGAIDYALVVADQFRSKIKLLHVVEQSPYEVYQIKGFLKDVPSYAPVSEVATSAGTKYIIKDILEATRSRLQDLVPKGKGGMFDCSVRHGHAVDEILNEVEEFKPDLVVMCTHGWQGITHMLVGSVAEKIVRHAPVPVLTIPRQKKHD